MAALLKKAQEKPKSPQSAVERGEGAGLPHELAKILEKEQREALRSSVSSTGREPHGQRTFG